MTRDDRIGVGPSADEFRAELRQWAESRYLELNAPPAPPPLVSPEDEKAAPQEDRKQGPAGNLSVVDQRATSAAPIVVVSPNPAPVGDSAVQTPPSFPLPPPDVAPMPSRVEAVRVAVPATTLRPASSPAADQPSAEVRHEVPPAVFTASAPAISAQQEHLAMQEAASELAFDAEPRASIALDEVIGRLGHVHWAEAVAIVEALCARLAPAGEKERAVPELSGVAITGEGTVLVGGRPASGLPGTALAHILHALTASSVIPAPLRLFIGKWTSQSTQHSVAGFAAELAFFARPNGTVLIQDVYERLMAAPRAPTQPSEQEREARPKSRPSRRRPLKPAMVVLVALVMASVLAFVMRDRLAGPARLSSDRLAGAVVALADRVGLAPFIDDAQVSPDASLASAPAVTARASGRSGRANRTAQSARPSARAAAPAGVSSASTTAPAPAPGARADAAVPASTREVVRGVSDDPLIVYSSQNPEVEPPAIAFPQLPTPLMAGLDGDPNRVELLVSETGSVERVRMLSTPRRMSDMMMLSSAKTWKFEPAHRFGEPVRYRLVVSWQVGP